MSIIGRAIDVVTMKSDRPMRRLLAYYGLLAVIVLVFAFLFPRLALNIAAKGLGEVSENPIAMTDALSAQLSAVGFGAGTLGELAITTLLILLGTLVLMLPVTWVYMWARPIPGHSQAIVQTLIILPIVVAAIVFIVQSSLALAFSLAGVMAAVRFRTTLRDTRDIVYIFLGIVVGFSAGVQSLAVGTIVSMFFNYVVVLAWQYNYGRSVLAPTAASQWLAPLQTLASETGEREIPDRDLVLSLTPAKADALAERFERVSGVLGKNKKKARYNSVLTVTSDKVTEAQARVERVLGDITKRWILDEVVTNTGKPSELYYLLRLKKSVPRDELLTAIHQAGDGLIATADLETGVQTRAKNKKE